MSASSRQPATLPFTELERRLAEAEAEAQRVRERCAALVRVVGQITWTRRADGQAEDLSQWSAYTGQTVEETQGNGWLDVIHPEDRKRVRDVWLDAVANSSPYEAEARIRRVDGAYRWHLVRGAPVGNADGSVREWVGVCADVTERRQAEEQRNQLLASEQNARATAEAAAHEIAALHTITDTALAHLALEDVLREALGRLRMVLHVDNVVILLLNEERTFWTVRAAHGLEERLTIGLRIPFGNGIPCEIATTREPRTIDDATQVSMLSMTARERLRSLAGVPLLVGGRVIGVVQVSAVSPRHFTEKDVQLLQRAADRIALAIDHARLYEQAQASRDEAERRARELEIVLDSLVDGVVVYDQDARVMRVNAAQRELLGLGDSNNETYLALPFTERAAALTMRDAHGQPLAVECAPQTRILRGETFKGACAEDIVVRTLDGRDIEVSVSGAPVRDAEGQITGAVIIYRDVTERRQLQRERDQMLNMVSHDLKSPLTVIKMRAQLMMRAMSLGRAPTMSHLEQIARDVDRMTRLTDDLLEGARVDTGSFSLTFQTCDLVVLCRQMADNHMMATGRLITLDLPTCAVEAEIDPLRVEQALGNFLSNALKYSPAHAAVTLRLRQEDDDVCILVQDEGPGIAQEALPHVFERYYRVPGVEPTHGGGASLGLGLYICRRLIELHGGRVGVESAPGAGTTFWFRLPLHRVER